MSQPLGQDNMSTIPCPYCQTSLPPGTYYCKHCNRNLPSGGTQASGASPGFESAPTRPVPIRNFEVKATPKAGFLGRLIGKVPREAAFVEVRNILATTSLGQVSESEIAMTLAKAKLLPRDAVRELTDIFEQAVLILSADRILDSADRQGLANLQRAFELTDKEAGSALERAVVETYKRTMTEALSDGKFTTDERERLTETARNLGMDEHLRAQIYATAARGAVQAAFSAAIADRRYAGREEAAVQELATALGATIAHDEKTDALIRRFKLLGQVEDGVLPVVAVPLLLQRNEICHFAAVGILHKEMRTVTKRVNYSGPTASIRIMKGVRWRVGSVSVDRITQDVLTQVDAGDFYLTSKRLLFQGARKNTAVALGKVIQFTVFSDGLQVEKGSGKDLYLVGQADWELAGACLDAAAREARA